MKTAIRTALVGAAFAFAAATKWAGYSFRHRRGYAISPYDHEQSGLIEKPLHRAPALVWVGVVLVAAIVAGSAPATAGALTKLSADPFTNSSSQHASEVEPDSFAFGSTIVATFQVGRFFDGGASDNGFATSRNGGLTWTNGFLSGITKYQGGTYDRVSDPSVAFDARHSVWLISSLALTETPSVSGASVLVSRSTDGGLTWTNPVAVAVGSDLDKNWIACDNTPSSPFYGRCYSEWDDHGDSNRIKMSTSVNGGASWGVALSTADSATGIGGQPLVQPNGNVIVPIANSSETQILAFRSVDGGATWGSTVGVASVSQHAVGGSLRTGPLPSAEIDRDGKIYVVWQDCRFRASCSSNDIVMSTTTQSSYPTWSAATRIPIDPITSGVDHFIPGLAVDPTTSGSSAHLALAYYYYPSANCTASTCELDIGVVSSSDSGSSWSAPTQLGGPMTLSWLASTSQGRMVGDYISTSFAGGTAFPFFALANAPSGGRFDEAIYTTATGPAPPPPGIVQNPGFETGSFSPWTVSGAALPAITTTTPHSGTYSARFGSPAPYNGNSIVQQTVTIPTGTSTLSFWYRPSCPDTLTYDQIQMQLRSTAGATLATVLNVCSNTGTWTQRTFNTTPYAGQTVVLWFNVHDDGYPSDPTYALLDDVAISGSLRPGQAGVRPTSPVVAASLRR